MAIDMEKLRASLKGQKAAMKVRGKTIKPQPGENRYHLLPGWKDGEEHIFHRHFGQHFVKDEKDVLQAVYLCLEATHGVECPVCVGLQRATRVTTDDETLQVLEKAKAGKVVLLNVLALDSEDPNTPVILEVKQSVYRAIVDGCEEWDGAPLMPTGNQIVIKREGKGLQTKYSVSISPKTHTAPAAAYERINNLDEYVKQESDENQRKAIGAINAVAGLLGAPGGDKPRTASAASTGEYVSSPTPETTSGVNLGESLEDMLADLEAAA